MWTEPNFATCFGDFQLDILLNVPNDFESPSPANKKSRKFPQQIFGVLEKTFMSRTLQTFLVICSLIFCSMCLMIFKNYHLPHHTLLHITFHSTHRTTLHTTLHTTPHTTPQTTLYSTLHSTLHTTLHTTLHSTLHSRPPSTPLHTTPHTTFQTTHRTPHHTPHPTRIRRRRAEPWEALFFLLNRI